MDKLYQEQGKKLLQEGGREERAGRNSAKILQPIMGQKGVL